MTETLRTQPDPDGSALAADRRRAREERHRHRLRRERRRTTAVIVVLLLASSAVAAWRFNTPGDGTVRASAQARPGVQSAQPKSEAGEITAAKAEAARQPDPTPIFGAYRSLQLRLPVKTLDLTEIAFHQASYSWALPMTTPLTDASLGAANKNRGTGRVPEELTGVSAVLKGSCLRLWRSNRPGKPDTAADIGAAPGSVVRSPVSGEVTLVRAYKLYGEHDDFEVHIRPDGWPEADVILIHIDAIEVEAGDQVVAGVTPIAVVRKLSDKERMQLGEYTAVGDGDHVHLQINQGDDPRYLDAMKKHLREGS